MVSYNIVWMEYWNYRHIQLLVSTKVATSFLSRAPAESIELTNSATSLALPLRDSLCTLDLSSSAAAAAVAAIVSVSLTSSLPGSAGRRQDRTEGRAQPLKRGLQSPDPDPDEASKTRITTSAKMFRSREERSQTVTMIFARDAMYAAAIDAGYGRQIV